MLSDGCLTDCSAVRLVALRSGRRLLAGLFTLAPAVLGAQPNAASPRAPSAIERPDAFRDTLTQVNRIVRAFLDNDLFALRDTIIPTDFEYTHGVGANAHWADAPARVRRWLGNPPGCGVAAQREVGCVMATLGVRQAIYTPPSNETFAVPGQRPHAGYLGLAGGVQHVRRHRLRALHVELGTTGRPALGAPVQQAIHEVTGSAPELGWRNQLVARPAFLVRADETWQAALRGLGAHLRVRGTWGAQAGTVRTGVFAGTELQLAPDRRPFWTPHDAGSALPLGPYLLGGVQQELVARDLFLDGHPGTRTLTAVRAPSVWQATVGLGWRFAGGSGEYRHVRRAREYAAQLRPHEWGAFVFTWYR